MKTTLRKTLAAAAVGVLVGAYGCGGGSGGDPAKAAAGSATLTGTLESGSLARQVPSGELAPVDVYAVNEQGEKVDAALGVTSELTLHLPWDHEYVLIFADARGILGAMVYGEAEQAAFSVESGVLSLELGRITIDPRKRRVKISDGSRLRPPAGAPHADRDGDGIPDHLDDDRDNDGIPDRLDTDDAGGDLSLDHDNDGVSSHDDEDDDDDGIADREDDEPNDRDNDGEDDDRDAGLGDPTLGGELWAAFCAGCHGEGLEDDESSVREIAEALAEGEGRRMPRFRSLVANAADLAAYLADPAGGDGEVPPPAPAPAADGDGDGVPDASDRCPTTFGAGADGCPVVTPPPAPPTDGDGDGVPDASDRCPTTFGAGADGCPVALPPPPPPPADTDGDGVIDTVDACPTQRGPASNGGCPLPPPPPPPVDTDGDGVVDTADACPTQRGPASNNGCPLPPPPPPPARPAILGTLCVGCHGDNSALVACTNSQWTRHNGARGTSAAQYQEVSTWATGGVCQ